MRVPVTMPKIGLTIEEVEVVEWLCVAGDEVVEGAPLVTVNADKSDVVIDAPATGTIDRIVAEVGAIVPIGGELAYIVGPGDTSDVPIDELQAPTPPDPERHAGPDHEQHDGPVGLTGEIPAPGPALAPTAPGPDGTGVRPRISPYARRLARDRRIDVAGLVGSGPGGRIVARDVPTVGQRREAVPVAAPRPVASLAASADAVEMIAVRLSHPRVQTIHLVAWAACRAVERLHPEWFDDHVLTVDIDRPDGRSTTVRWARSVAFSTWCDRIDEAVAPSANHSKLRVVHLDVDDVEPGIMPSPHPSPITIVCAGLRSAARVREGEVVMRPRLPLTATYDPIALRAMDAARLVAGTAEQLSRAGALLDALPHRWHTSTT